MIEDIHELNFPKHDGKQYATLTQATAALQDMGEKTITTQVKIDGEITPDFTYDWAVEFQGEKYIMPLRKPQGAKENTSLNSTIDLTFQHWAIYQLKRWYLPTMQPIESGTAVPDQYIASVSLNLENFCDLLGQVLEYYYGEQITVDLNPQWQGAVEPTAVEISRSYIWDVLIKLYELYAVRWSIEAADGNDNLTEGGERYVIKVGYGAAEADHIFEYGFEGGLLKVERQVQDENIRNMIIGRGGSKNLPHRYFKDKDPANPTFAADPDWIPELANIPFTALRGATFRSYIQGWKARHYPNYEITTPTAEQAYAPWAWMRGYTDMKFNPVEYVADAFTTANNGYGVAEGSSIAEYGGLMDGLDDEDTYPTIQGVERDGIGRIDEAVEVEPVTTDDIEEATEADAKVTDFNTMSNPGVIAAGVTATITVPGDSFTVAEGKTANLELVGASVQGIEEICPPGLGRCNRRALSEGMHFEVEDKEIIVYDSEGDERTASGITEGDYRFEVKFTIRNKMETNASYIRYIFTAMYTNVKLMEADAPPKWKGRWSFLAKNIWGSVRRDGESDEAYAERVWGPILGDRTGEEAKVVFADGALAASEDYEFVITDIPVYERKLCRWSTTEGGAEVVHEYYSEWRIPLAKSDADLETLGVYIPSVQRQAVAGDHFFFTGIDMLHMYVSGAEKRLDDGKKDELAEVKDIKPTWVVGLDKVRIHNYGEAGALVDQLRVGSTLRLADKRFIKGAYETLYVQSVTYTYTEPTDTEANLLPDVEIVLGDSYATSSNPVASLSGEVNALKKQVGSISNIEQVVRAVGDKLYLRKDGISDRSLSPTEFASLLTSYGFRNGIIGGKGWGFFKDANGSWVLETDRINVRQDMQVNTLVINNVEGRGGMTVESAARMEVTAVVETAEGYICYFDQKQGTVANLFHVDDVAYSARFSADETSLSFYKRRVMAVDAGSITLTKGYDPVALPDGTSDTGVNGIGSPEPGDIIIHYGNYTDKERQYIKVSDVVGGGYERYLEGLDSVNAEGEEYYFVGRQAGMYGDKPRWYVGVPGCSIEFAEGELTLDGVKLTVNSRIGDKTVDKYIGDVADDAASKAKEELQANIDELQKQVDGVIETYNGLVDPTLENEPASSWTTEEERHRHLGDVYFNVGAYDPDTNPNAGVAWRWTYYMAHPLYGYGWTKIADSDAVRALQLAQMSVLDTDVYYIQTSSATAAPAVPTVNTSGTITDYKGWSTAAPAWQEGKYIWQTTYVRKGDGSATFTSPTCISGKDGRGIARIVEEYYLSTSRTELAGESWSETRPAWVAGRYYWTRSHIYYTDGTDEAVGAVCVTGEAGADGTSVLARYSSDQTNWHPTPLADDIWMQTSTDGSNWSPAYRFVGVDGSNYSNNLMTATAQRFEGEYDTDGDHWFKVPECAVHMEQGKTYTISGQTNGVFTNRHTTYGYGYVTLWIVSPETGGTVACLVSGTEMTADGTKGTAFTWQFPTGDYCLRVNFYDAGAWWVEKVKVEEGAVEHTQWTPAASEMTGKDGQWRKHQWAKNTSTSTEPTSGWQDTPMTAAAGEYVWMRSGIVVPPATEPTKWDTAVRLTGDKGADGQSVYMLDLSNEVAGVICNSAGTVTGSYPTSKASVYKGASKVTSGIEYAIAQKTGISTATIDTSGNITMSGLTADTAQIVVQAVVDNSVTLQSAINLYKVKPGADGDKGDAAVVYSIEASTDSITKNADGSLSHENISVTKYKTTGTQARQTTTEKSVVRQYHFADGSMEGTTVAEVGTPSANVAVTSGCTAIVFILYDDDDTVLDRERIPIIEDASGIEVGGTNLLPGTQRWDGWSMGESAALTSDYYNTCAVAHMNNPSGSGSDIAADIALHGKTDFKTNGIYALSFWAKGSGQLDSFCTPDLNSTIIRTNGRLSWYANTNMRYDLTADWQRFYVVFKPTATGLQGKNIVFRTRQGNEAYLCGAKLERGNVNTEWSPSPSDTDYLTEALRDATQETTTIDGGLILASVMRMGYTADDGYHVMSGVSGQHKADTSPAIWAGGDWHDLADGTLTDAQKEKAAKFLMRMDGTGYAAGNTLRFRESQIGIGRTAEGDDVLTVDADGMHMLDESTGETNLNIGKIGIAANEINTYVTPNGWFDGSISGTCVASAVKGTAAGPILYYTVTSGILHTIMARTKLPEGAKISGSADFSLAWGGMGLNYSLKGTFRVRVYNSGGQEVLNKHTDFYGLKPEGTIKFSYTVPEEGEYYATAQIYSNEGGAPGTSDPKVGCSIIYKGGTENPRSTQTILGKDGFVTVWGKSLLLVDRNHGVTMRSGKFGLRVTEDGIQYNKDGTDTWTDLV